MGIDFDDRLLLYGTGMNDAHQKKVKERIVDKRFLPTFCYDNTASKKYHYTSPEGLKGIMETRTFFFTDSQFLNDFREKININDELTSFWKNSGRMYEKEFSSLLRNIRVEEYEDSGFSYILDHSETKCRYFVLSLSTDSDSLSMWKYYAKNNSYDGYCLGLFSIALTDEWIDRVSGVSVISSQVEYRSEDKQLIIKRAVDRLYDIWKSYEISDVLNEKIQKEFSSWLSVEALFFKDECFSDERETRYVAIAPVDSLRDLQYTYKGCTYKMYGFRFVNGVLTPYIKMPFSDWNREACWAIDYIGIGPSANADQKEAGLRQFIRSLDYKLENCSIIKSEIPVRY